MIDGCKTPHPKNCKIPASSFWCWSATSHPLCGFPAAKWEIWNETLGNKLVFYCPRPRCGYHLHYCIVLHIARKALCIVGFPSHHSLKSWGQNCILLLGTSCISFLIILATCYNRWYVCHLPVFRAFKSHRLFYNIVNELWKRRHLNQSWNQPVLLSFCFSLILFFFTNKKHDDYCVSLRSGWVSPGPLPPWQFSRPGRGSHSSRLGVSTS